MKKLLITVLIVFILLCVIRYSISYKVTGAMKDFTASIETLDNVTDARFEFQGYPRTSMSKVYLVITVDREISSVDDPLVLEVFHLLIESEDAINDINKQSPVECCISFYNEETGERMYGFDTRESGGFNYETWLNQDIQCLTLTPDGITVEYKEDGVETYSFVE